MKVFQFIFVLSLLCASTPAQTVQSTCTAPGSIIQLYQDDADRITVKRFYQFNYTYSDSVKIPASYSDTVLRALIAVYNATALPARNAVVSTYSIHTFSNPSLNKLNVFADSTLPWMQQLKQNNIPTGNSQIDNLLANYSLTVQNYSNWFGLYSYHMVRFTSLNNLNLAPLANTFTTIPNVSYAELPSIIGDGNNITATVTPNYVDLSYKLAWGDCPAGCIYSHYWNFRVYYDCTVEWMGEFGYPIDVLPTPSIIVSGKKCVNSIVSVNVTNANSIFVNNQLVTGPQFTLSSNTATSFTIAAFNSSVYPILTTSAGATFTIAACNSNLTGLTVEPSAMELRILPNPANESFTIYGANTIDSENTMDVEVYNAQGQTIYVTKIDTKSEIPIRISTADLPDGIYFVSFISPLDGVLTKRLVVSH